jgi:hypothetical protein
VKEASFTLEGSKGRERVESRFGKRRLTAKEREE